MPQAEIAPYASQVGVAYPTMNGADLYRIAEIIPRWRRTASEAGLDGAIGMYYNELARQGHEPPERPIPSLLMLYMRSGIVSVAELFTSYQQACADRHGQAFLKALQQHNMKAVQILQSWLMGKQRHDMVVIDYVAGDTLAQISENR